MKLKQLGNGGGLAFTQTNASFLIERSPNNYLLFDCGYNIMQELVALDKSDDLFLLENLNTVFISHMHEDHIGNLTGLIYHRYFMLNKQTNIVCGPKVKEALIDYLDLLCSITYKSSKLQSASMYEFSQPSSMLAIEGNHQILPSYGMLLGAQALYKHSNALFISGDTKADTNIEKRIHHYGLHRTRIYHDFSNWNAPSSNPHMCQSDMEAEYSPEFIAKLNFYHDGRQDFNREWITL
mgnify:CR=1 FL=1